jgi:hypothetical protein
MRACRRHERCKMKKDFGTSRSQLTIKLHQVRYRRKGEMRAVLNFMQLSQGTEDDVSGRTWFPSRRGTPAMIS